MPETSAQALNTLDISLSVSTPTSAEGRRLLELGMQRLKAAGLDIAWRPIVETRPVRGALGGFEAGAHVDGKLRLYDTPESVADKMGAARSVIDRLRDTSERTTHLDSNGIERTPNQWGYNSHATQAGAERSARLYGRRKTHWFIWRLADGTFDYTAHDTRHLDAEHQMPGHPAELVNEIDV